MLRIKTHDDYEKPIQTQVQCREEKASPLSNDQHPPHLHRFSTPASPSPSIVSPHPPDLLHPHLLPIQTPRLPVFRLDMQPHLHPLRKPVKHRAGEERAGDGAEEV